MPVFEFGDTLRPLTIDRMKVLAVMLFPDDEEALRQWVIKVGIDILQHGREPNPDFPVPHTPPFVLKILSDSPSSEDISSGVLERIQHGRIAADIVLSVLSLSKVAPQHATIRKAIRLEGVSLVRESAGHPASSPTALKSIWSRFKSVSHLWAAVACENARGRDSFISDLLHFMAVAEQLRVLGESHRALGGRKNSARVGSMTLDPETTWKAPTGLVLPYVELRLPRPTAWTLDQLRNYRADR